MIGIWTSGSASFGIDWYASAPATRKKNMIDSVSRALRIARPTISMGLLPWSLLRAAGEFAGKLADGLRVGFDGVDRVAFRHQILAGDDDAGIGRDAAEHQPLRRVVDQVDREEHDLGVLVDGADAEIAGCADSVTTERGRTIASAGGARSVISAVMPAGSFLSSLGIATSMRKVRVAADASRLM